MRILDGLKPNGVFAYAPGLAFFERLIGPEFAIERRTWGDPTRSLAELTSSTQVRRLC